ncbi:MAG: malonyl-CoA decarboxylase [Comamonas sp.]
MTSATDTSPATAVDSAANSWLQKSAAWLRSVGIPTELGSSSPPEGERSTTERLKATLRRGNEALSPRELRRLLADLQAVAASEVSDAEGGRLAEPVMQWYATAQPEQRMDCWRLLCEQFVPDVAKIGQARQRYEDAVGTAGMAAAERQLRKALQTPRMRLLQRFAVPAQGMRFLLDLRAQMLPQLKSHEWLVAVDADLEYLFSTWFDIAFLELRSLSWDSPASLLEKLIKYEAVHDIRSWTDLKNRLDSDRRCYGFFHPRLPNEPLIFVEVALVDKMSDSIAPLLDEAAAATDVNKASTAIFYSISNTQTGLRGVSFGDSLIKTVVEQLLQEFPKLRQFATLSPIPGFRSWLGKHAAEVWDAADKRLRADVGKALDKAEPTVADWLAALEQPAKLKADDAVAKLLLYAAARYLGKSLVQDKPVDPVARFHLGNGSRVERLNWAGDTSVKGIKQSYGLMVNYLYDLKRLDKHRNLLAQGKIPVSSGIEALAKV